MVFVNTPVKNLEKLWTKQCAYGTLKRESSKNKK